MHILLFVLLVYIFLLLSVFIMCLVLDECIRTQELEDQNDDIEIRVVRSKERYLIN